MRTPLVFHRILLLLKELYFSKNCANKKAGAPRKNTQTAVSLAAPAAVIHSVLFQPLHRLGFEPATFRIREPNVLSHKLLE
jgi:hypothetical protein